jgi:hypothetical protein
MNRPHDDAPEIVSFEAAPPGWYAVWRDDSGEVLEPVAGWALVSQGGYRWVEALVPYGESTAALELACRRNGYCGLRYFTPGNEPSPAWASDQSQ